MFKESYQVRSLADAAPDIRAQFIRRTYLHLAIALFAFVVIEAFLLQSEVARALALQVLGAPFGWLMVLGGFMLVGWLARGFAHAASQPVQYAGLALYVLVEAVVFLPLVLLALAVSGGDASILVQAGVMTALLLLGLTATVFITRADFSFLKSALTVGVFVALGLIVLSIVFGFSLGLFFSGATVVFAAAAILYDTSKVLHEYDESQYVGASLELFASTALLLWYILRILIALRD